MHSKHHSSSSNRQRSSILLSAAAIIALLASQPILAGGVPKKTFPRLGGYQIGDTPFEGYSDPAYHREMAKLDYVIIGSTLTSTNDAAAAIRRLNPDIMLVKYRSLMEVSETAQGSYMKSKRLKVSSEDGPNRTNAHDWWARDLNGNHVSNWPGNWTVNITEWVKPDANGDRYPEWVAKLHYDLWLKHPAWDGIFEDTVYWKPRGTAVDWSGGQVTDRARINSAFRMGHQAYWNELKRLAPDKYIFVNHDWYMSESASALGRWDLPEYDKQVHGGLLEIVMLSSDLEGKPRTLWRHTLEFYRRSAKYFLEPDMTMFLVKGERDNWRFFRYSFATCLLDDGYFDYVPNDGYQYGTVEWFDEFDLAGTAGTDWLGLAIDPPPESAWQAGVWRRDFQGGVALVNPQGNGVRTVTVEPGLYRIAGKQDPQVNNGRSADQITLLDGDGIILVREQMADAPVAPKPPELRPQ
jgi:hypothetical protein